ncbi:cob(I)yrinic acid a,c-diamide adenosyltransferase [Cellulosilyticum sp. I15G10I2]|uniref:cob(I)yrinic acid a,c-diamide adenosyltransferase n=1 Tax=Cellulosilyticum sp. I15G10I2 TaxID=1892843 RepID=UPI00085C822A|nr:cob(I)yrinic acid a,c-diamide adenosyltransferase [Cellulosilyticum sp. I15G10I2]
MKNGLVQVYYGDGKGKTTSAVGLGIRAVGNNYKVIMIQFLKNDLAGECKIIRDLEPYFKVFHFEKEHGLTWTLTEEEKEELRSETKNALNFAIKVMDTAECDVLILDEILNVVEEGIIAETELCELIDHKPDEMELVLTGRNLTECIAKRADSISCVKAIKHPAQKDMLGRAGMEY